MYPTEKFIDIVFHTDCTGETIENSGMSKVFNTILHKPNVRNITSQFDESLLKKNGEKNEDFVNDTQKHAMKACNLENIKSLFNLDDTAPFTYLYNYFKKHVFTKTLQLHRGGGNNLVYRLVINKMPVVLRVMRPFGDEILKEKSIDTKNKYYIEEQDEYRGAFIQNYLQNKCNSEYIPKLYAMGKITDSNNRKRVFLLMEYCGDSLQNKYDTDQLGIQNVVQHMKQIFSAIKCMHDNSFVHRDIKLDNISMKKDNNGNDKIYLLDFGAAQHTNYCSGLFTKTPNYTPYSSYIQYEYKLFDKQSELLSKRVLEYDLFALSLIIIAYIQPDRFNNYYNNFNDTHFKHDKYLNILYELKGKVLNLYDYASIVFRYNTSTIIDKYKKQKQLNQEENIIVNNNYTRTFDLLVTELQPESGGKKSRKKQTKTKKNKKNKKKQKKQKTNKK